jgi:hypothetical protein
MRTCAAAIEASKDNSDPWNMALIGDDAARLLRIAADELDTTEEEPIGDPMEVLTTTVGGIDRGPSPNWQGGVGKPVWGGSLNASAAPCPACGSIDARTVKRIGGQFQLTCPSCQHQWEYGR